MSLAIQRRRTSAVRGIVSACALAASIPAHADDAPPGWSGKGQAGYLMSRGNSDADSLNAALDMNLVRQDWKHELTLDYLYGKSAGIVSAERWDGRLQSDYAITSKLFAFGALNYQNDKFSGFQYQASVTGGVGYKFLDTSATKLAAQVGFGYRSLRTEELVKDDAGAVIERIPGESQSELVGTAGLDFAQNFNSNTKLTDKLNIESGSSNTSIKNSLALEVKMSKKLSLATAYGIVDNTNPPAGFQQQAGAPTTETRLKSIDQTVTLNLVYAFPAAR